MSCSKNSAIKYLIHKNLVKPNMELYTVTPDKRLVSTIESLTKLASSKYNVNMGDLFRIRFRDIDKGNYLNLGSSITATKARLEPNDPAFEAIDVSVQQEYNKQEAELNNFRIQQEQKIKNNYQEVENTGNIVTSDQGEVNSPKNLPKINIRC